MAAGKLGENIKAKETEGVFNGEEKQVKEKLDSEKKIKIIIPSTETDREDVKIGICGYPYAIMRDVPVEVPLSVVKVLQDAIVTTYKQVPRDGKGEGFDLVPFESMRYPFRVINED